MSVGFGGEDDYTINMRLDNSQAVQAIRQMVTEFEKLEAAAKKAGGAHTKAGQKAKAAMSEAEESTKSFRATLMEIGTAAAGIGLIVSAMRTYNSVLAEANKLAHDQAEELIKLKGTLRELAAMKGTSPSDTEVKKFMDVRAASGLSKESAESYVKQLVGAGEGMVGTNIPQKEWERFQSIGARYAASQGGGPGEAGTYGLQAGLLLGVGKYKTAEDLLAAQIRVNEINSVGVGANPVLVRQEAEIMGSMLNEMGTGIARTPEEHAAMVTTASRISPNQAADTLRQTAAVLRGFGRKWEPLLKQAGITPEQSLPEAMQHLFAEIEKAEKQHVAPDVFLQQQGVPGRNVQKIVSMYTYRNLFNQMMAKAQQPMTGQEAMERLNQKFAEGPDLQLAQEQAKLEAAQLKQGAKLQAAPLLETQARRRIEERGQGPQSPEAAEEDWESGVINMGNLPMGIGFGSSNVELGRRIREEEELYAMARERGIEVPGRPQETRTIIGRLSGTDAKNLEYLNWLTSGESTRAYAMVGQEMQRMDAFRNAKVQEEQLRALQHGNQQRQVQVQQQPRAMTRVRPGGGRPDRPM